MKVTQIKVIISWDNFNLRFYPEDRRGRYFCSKAELWSHHAILLSYRYVVESAKGSTVIRTKNNISSSDVV